MAHRAVVPLNLLLPEPLDAALALLDSPAGESHWSSANRRQLDRLLAEHPAARWEQAEELARVVARLGETGGALHRAVVPTLLGDRAIRYCAPIAVALDAVVDETNQLLGELRAAAHRAERLLAELVSAAEQVRGEPPDVVSRALRGVLDDHEEHSRGDRGVAAGCYPPASDGWAPESWTRDTGARDSSAPVPGAPDSWARDSWAPVPGAPDSWARDSWARDTGAPDSWAPDSWARDSWARDTGAPDSWAREPWTRRPGPPVRLEPGVGPILAGTEGERPTTDMGVRVAQLPSDGAPG